jgi:integrase
VDARIGTHTLRKTFAYAAYQKGVPLPEIQKILNHSSQETTLAYMGITQEDLDAVFRETDPFSMPRKRTGNS